MIDVLMRKGNAYRSADGSVYFKISSFPGYGALSRIKERELKVTNSVFDADHKDDSATSRSGRPSSPRRTAM
jgi:cysteinyl-tRNA synthetase